MGPWTIIERKGKGEKKEGGGGRERGEGESPGRKGDCHRGHLNDTPICLFCVLFSGLLRLRNRMDRERETRRGKKKKGEKKRGKKEKGG